MNELIKEAINPKTGKKVVYNDKWHTYTLDGGKKLTSSTKFVKQFFPPFDSDKWSAIIAKRDGKTQAQVLKEWADKAKTSTDFGTGVHEYVEALLKKEVPVRNNNPRVKAVRNNVRATVESLIQEWEPIGIEKIVFNDKVSGTLDVLFKHKWEENRYLLGDWKTNKEITKDNKYNQYGLSPIQHIPDTNFYHYALQLSLYQFLLVSEGFIEKEAIIDRKLFHIKPFNTEPIELPYLEKEIVLMLRP